MTEPWRRFQRLPRWMRRTAWVTLVLAILAAVAAGGGGSDNGRDTRAADVSQLDVPAPTTSVAASPTRAAASRPIVIRSFHVRPVPAGLRVLLGWARAHRGVRWRLSVRATGPGLALAAAATGTGRPDALRFTRTVQLDGRWAGRTVTTRLTVMDAAYEATGTRVVRMRGGAPASNPVATPRTPVAPRVPTPSQRCDPDYRGACLDPTASDYDCAGGGGNGPEYTGRVEVVGVDHWGLDRDGDGVGCEDSSFPEPGTGGGLTR